MYETHIDKNHKSEELSSQIQRTTLKIGIATMFGIIFVIIINQGIDLNVKFLIYVFLGMVGAVITTYSIYELQFYIKNFFKEIK